MNIYFNLPKKFHPLKILNTQISKPGPAPRRHPQLLPRHPARRSSAARPRLSCCRATVRGTHQTELQDHLLPQIKPHIQTSQHTDSEERGQKHRIQTKDHKGQIDVQEPRTIIILIRQITIKSDQIYMMRIQLINLLQKVQECFYVQKLRGYDLICVISDSMRC